MNIKLAHIDRIRVEHYVRRNYIWKIRGGGNGPGNCFLGNTAKVPYGPRHVGSQRKGHRASQVQVRFLPFSSQPKVVFELTLERFMGLFVLDFSPSLKEPVQV